MHLTNEQKEIVDFWADLYEPRHLIVNAKAGTGKSTVSLLCAENLYRTKKYHSIFLTFSTMLKLDARRKIRSIDNDYVQVENFHSSVANIFGFKCVDQQTLEQFLENENVEPIYDLSNVGLLVIDESQDLTESFVILINRIRNFLHPDHHILMLGDRFQNVFKILQNSSTKYIDCPSDYFGGIFHRLPLSNSFRVTQKMATWINTNLNPNMLRHHYPDIWKREGKFIQEAWGGGIQSLNPLNGTETETDVDFVKFNYYKEPIPDLIQNTVSEYISKYGVESVLLLVQSCRMYSSHPATKLLNRMGGNMNTNWVVLNGDFQETNTILQNKGIVATPFKMKGREKKLVVFFGLDNNLEKWTDKEHPMLALAIAYVSCTRASEKLIIVGNACNNDFFTMKNSYSQPPQRIQKRVYVSSLTRYVPYNKKIDHIVTSIVRRVQKVNITKLFVSGRTTKTFESVYKWYATAIKDAIPEELEDQNNLSWHQRIREIISCHSRSTGMMYIQRQLSNYDDWVDTDLLDRLLSSAIDMIYSQFSTCTFETMLSVQYKRVLGNVFLVCNKKHVIHYCFSNSFDVSQAQESLLHTSLLFDDSIKDVKVYVMNPVIGELRLIHEVEGFTRREYLKACLDRKQLSYLIL